MPFEGNPDKVLDAAIKEGEEGAEAEAEAAPEDEEGEGKEKDSDETEDEEISVPKRDLKGKFNQEICLRRNLNFCKLLKRLVFCLLIEIDRLTFVVYAIENDC